jgi:uncharacterized membrane protein YfbV (UPF0208 family)
MIKINEFCYKISPIINIFNMLVQRVLDDDRICQLVFPEYFND